MNTPIELKYARSHEWVRELENGTVEIGLTYFAQYQMGDLVFAELPEVGDTVTCGESFANVESVKAVSEVFSPVTGVVLEVNEAVLDDSALINEDPYGAWMVRVGEISEWGELLSAVDYDKVCEEEE